MAKRKARKPAKKRKPTRKVKELRGHSFDPITDYAEGIPQPEPFSDLMRAYQASPWAYAAIFAIANNLAGIGFPFLRKKVDSKGHDVFIEAEDHSIGQVIKNPNRYMTEYDLKEATFAMIELTGNAFWLLENMGTGEVKEIWPVPSHLVQVVSSKTNLVDHYVYNVGHGRGIRYEADEVIHFHDFNPMSMVYGQGSTVAARTNLTIDLFQEQYNKYFFLNSGRPDAVIEVENELDNESRKRMHSAWRKMHQGIKSAHRFAILENGAKLKPSGFAGKDMEFMEGHKKNREAVLAAYGVPPIVVGVLEHANYANAEQQYKAFWVNTLIPKIKKFQATLTMRARQITLITDTFVEGDTSKVEALREDELKKGQIAQVYVNLGIPVNMVIDALNLPFDHIEGGDEPGGMANLFGNFGGVNDSQGQSAEPDAEKDPKKRLLQLLRKAPPRAKALPTPERIKPAAIASQDKQLDDPRTVAWKRFDNNIRPREEAMEFEMRKMFSGQRRRVIRAIEDNKDAIFPKPEEPTKSLIDSAKAALGISVKAKNEPKAAAIVEMIFSTDAERERMAKAAVRHIRGTYFDAIVEMGNSLETGFSFNLADPVAQAWVDGKVLNLVTQATSTTKEAISREIVDAVQDALSEGLSQGEAISTIAGRIDDVYGFAMKNRSKLIARTEIIGASNAGGLEGMRAAGAEGKEWLTSRDGDVRDTHAAMDGDTVGLKEGFIIKGGPSAGQTLAYPGDPGGPVGEIANCRCTVLPVVSDA